MTFLPIDRPVTPPATRLLAMLGHKIRTALPAITRVDGETAQRRNLLRAEARAAADRLLR